MNDELEAIEAEIEREKRSEGDLDSDLEDTPENDIGNIVQQE